MPIYYFRACLSQAGTRGPFGPTLRVPFTAPPTLMSNRSSALSVGVHPGIMKEGLPGIWGFDGYIQYE